MLSTAVVPFSNTITVSSSSCVSYHLVAWERRSRAISAWVTVGTARCGLEGRVFIVLEAKVAVYMISSSR